MRELTVLEVLTGALRRRLGGLDSGVLDDLAPDTIQAALDLAAANKTLTLFADSMKYQLSERQLLGLDQYKRAAIGRNSGILHESLRITRKLRDDDVRHVFIKGPTQQAALYGDFFVRPSLDIDILVSGRDYDRALRSLAGLDYRVASKSLWWRTFLGEQHLAREGRMDPTVDLHYRLQQPGSPAPKDTAGYLAEAAECPFLDDHLPRLGDADIPLLSAISIVKALYHRETAGSHVADLFVSLRAGAPEMVNYFLLRADQQGIAGPASLALRVAAEAFGFSLAGTNAERVLATVTSADLLRLVFTPDDPTLIWPKRRVVLWELCRRRPMHFALEAARAVASEATLRVVERRSLATVI